MNTREQIIVISWEVHDLLTGYIKIHDSVFKTSIRFIIPIPRIFKVINFHEHLIKIEKITIDLTHCKTKVSELIKSANNDEREYLNILLHYIQALIETTNSFATLLNALYAKSQSFIHSNYNWNKYNKDLAIYKRSQQDYLSIAGDLMKSYQKNRLDQPITINSHE